MQVREITGIEEKSLQEREQEILETADETTIVDPQPEATDPQPAPQFSEEDVLSHIRERYNREINSLDELFAAQQEEMPEDVAAYYKYRKETGRGIEDFIKVQQDVDALPEDQILRDYLLSTGEATDKDDVDLLMDEYSYDEELDEEKDIKRKKLAKKKIVAKAKEYFKEQKEKYKAPLESSGVGTSSPDYEAFKQYQQEAAKYQEESAKQSQWFAQKTDEVLGKEFKGFEFNVDGQKFTVSFGNADEIKKQHSSPMNLLNKFMDEKGYMKDAAGYHKALAIAMNPDGYAKHFYELGKAAATEDVTKRMKNIDMSERRQPEVTKKGGMQVKAMDTSSGRGLRIKFKE